jgi:hypothetical protein
MACVSGDLEICTLASAAMFESGAKTLAHDSNIARRKHGQHEEMGQHTSDDHLEKVCC